MYIVYETNFEPSQNVQSRNQFIGFYRILSKFIHLQQK